MYIFIEESGLKIKDLAGHKAGFMTLISDDQDLKFQAGL